MFSSFNNRNKQKTIRKRYNIDDDDEDSNKDGNNDKDIDSGSISTIPKQEEQEDDIKEQRKENIIQSAYRDNIDEDEYYQPSTKKIEKKKTVNTFKTSTAIKKPITTTKTISLFDQNDDDDENNINVGRGSSYASSSTTSSQPSITLRNQALKSIKMTSMMKSNDFDIQSTATSSLYHQSIGEYTAENLNKLKKETTSRSSIRTKSNQEESEPSSTMDIDDDENGEDGGNSLPTIEQIKAAKEKRERLRREQKEGGDGFIPLDSRKKISGSGTTTKKSVQNVDMDSDNDDDEESGNEDGIGGDKSNIRKFITPEEKGISKEGVDESINVDSDEEDSEVIRWHREQIQKGGGISNKAAMDSKSRKHQQDLLHQTKDNQIGDGSSYARQLQRDIDIALERMEDVHFTHKSDLSRAESALEDSQHLLMKLESDLSVVEDELHYYYEFEDYIKNMEACMDEKIPQIDELESRMMDLESHYIESKGKGTQQQQEEEEEFYQSEKKKIKEMSEKVLEDVDEEYSQLEHIRNRFQSWKQKNYSTYKRIHLGYIIPAIFAPFVTLQLLQWNPLENSHFDKYPWFSQLSNYGILKNVELDQDDPDHNLIPKLVSNIVTKKVKSYIQMIWDPLLPNQTKNLLLTIEEILVYLDHLSSPLFNVIIEKFGHFMKKENSMQLNASSIQDSIQLFLVMVRFYKLFDSDSKYTLSHQILDFINQSILQKISQTTLWENLNDSIPILNQIIDHLIPIKNEKKKTSIYLIQGLLMDIESSIPENNETDHQRLSQIKDKLLQCE